MLVDAYHYVAARRRAMNVFDKYMQPDAGLAYKDKECVTGLHSKTHGSFFYRLHTINNRKKIDYHDIVVFRIPTNQDGCAYKAS